MSSSCERCQGMGHEMSDLKCVLAKTQCDKHDMQAKLEALRMQLDLLHCKLEESEKAIRVKTATNDELGKQIMEFHEKNVKLEAENKEMKRKMEEMEALMKEI